MIIISIIWIYIGINCIINANVKYDLTIKLKHKNKKELKEYYVIEKRNEEYYIVKYFPDWVDIQWKSMILQIITPIHFILWQYDYDSKYIHVKEDDINSITSLKEYFDNIIKEREELINKRNSEDKKLNTRITNLNTQKHLCNCGNIATWLYMPGFSSGANSFICDDCITSVDDDPCSCNYRYDKTPEGIEGVDWKWIEKDKVYYNLDKKGRPYPCSEYEYDENGYSINEDD